MIILLFRVAWKLSFIIVFPTDENSRLRFFQLCLKWSLAFLGRRGSFFVFYKVAQAAFSTGGTQLAPRASSQELAANLLSSIRWCVLPLGLAPVCSQSGPLFSHAVAFSRGRLAFSDCIYIQFKFKNPRRSYVGSHLLPNHIVYLVSLQSVIKHNGLRGTILAL